MNCSPALWIRLLLVVATLAAVPATAAPSEAEVVGTSSVPEGASAAGADPDVVLSSRCAKFIGNCRATDRSSIGLTLSGDEMRVHPAGQAALDAVRGTRALSRVHDQMNRAVGVILSGTAGSDISALDKTLRSTLPGRASTDLRGLFNLFASEHGPLQRFRVEGAETDRPVRHVAYASPSYVHGSETVHPVRHDARLQPVQWSPIPAATMTVAPATSRHLVIVDLEASNPRLLRFTEGGDGSFADVTITGTRRNYRTRLTRPSTIRN